MKSAILIMLTVIFIMSCINTAVFSHEVPDLGRLGSISVKMSYGGNAVSGGSITLYRVADIVVDDGDYSFTFSGEFDSFDADITDLESQQLIFTIASYIAENKLMGIITMPIDNNGNVCFCDLKPGLYMLIQDTAAKGYNCVNPFLVSLPMFTDGKYLYDVDASAKVELTKNNNKPHVDTTTDTGRNTTGTDGNRLPQTGQLEWPIPIFAVTGAGLILVGLMLCFGTRKTDNES